MVQFLVCVCVLAPAITTLVLSACTLVLQCIYYACVTASVIVQRFVTDPACELPHVDQSLSVLFVHAP